MTCDKTSNKYNGPLDANQQFTSIMAYWVWRQRHYVFGDVDKKLSSFLNITENGPSLREAREASFLTLQSAARRMGVHVTTYREHERRALDETITIRALKAAAQAIDCELVYAIRSKRRSEFSAVIWNQLRPFISNQKCAKLRSYFKANAMASLARDLVLDPSFRRERGWSEQANKLHFARNFRFIARGPDGLSERSKDCPRHYEVNEPHRERFR